MVMVMMTVGVFSSFFKCFLEEIPIARAPLRGQQSQRGQGEGNGGQDQEKKNDDAKKKMVKIKKRRMMMVKTWKKR